MTLLLALLLCTPERVVVVAKPPQRPGFFHQVGEAVRKGAQLLHLRSDPDVDQGNALAAQNDPEGALSAYDRALPRLKDSPELHYDRAGQLLKLGSEQAQHAHDEATAAMQSRDPLLKSRAAFDLGLSYEEMGKPDQAIKAYEQALALNPGDRDAQVNLELLLHQEEKKQQMPQQQKQQQQEQSKDQPRQQKDKSKGDEQQKDQQQEAGQKEEKKQEQEQPGAGQEKEKDQQEQAKQQQEQKQQRAGDEQVDRSEAQRLLDALRASEKNLQTWRFAKHKRKEARRGDVEKDW